jgi:hypothetical protein
MYLETERLAHRRFTTADAGNLLALDSAPAMPQDSEPRHAE